MKKHLLFNQSFGTEDSPNQTGEALTRENRIGLMSYLRRTLMLLFAVLVLSIANIGTAWGAGTTAKTISEGDQYFSAYKEAKTNLSTNNWVSTSGSPGNNSSSYTAPSGWLDGGSGKPGVGFMNVQSGKTVIFTVTNITGVSILGCSNNTSSRTINLSVKTGGVEVGSVVTKTTSSNSVPEVITYGSVLDKTKTYTITVSASDGNNARFMQIKFVGASAASTKRIYMKAGAWNNDSPKFFVHSWGASNSDLQMTALGGCETDVFYADIPSGNTSLLFTRQNPSSSGIKYKDEDGNWNQSVDITISSNDLFTFNGNWSQSDGKSGFNGGTYSAPTTYTITYAANGGGGSMSATSGICPDADQAITNNAFTKPSGCASFAHWTANVAVKVGGSNIVAGNPIANGAIIQDINSNITLTAVWKLNKPDITDNEDNTFSISGSIDGASYYYTIDGATPTTSSSLYSAPVDFSAGAVNITAKAIAHKDGYVDSDVKSQSCTYHEPPVCAISDCGNATLTYAITVGSSGSHSTGGADLISSATPSNPTALGASTTAGYTGISMSDLTKKAAAATNSCGNKPNMTGKIGVYNGASYSSSNYLQFTFTVKEGYTFTPCDIQFIVQPVDVATNFRWEVTNGTNVYGYGTATDVPKGSDGGASVLTGLTSTAAMEAGTYYIRLYPYVNTASKTFRLGTDVILKGTTAAAACVAPTSVNITGTYHYFPGETISLTAAAEGGSGTPTTYQWYKGGTADENIIEGATSATYNKAKCTYADAGSYYCKVTRGGSCSTFSDNYDVKILHLYVNTGRNGTPYKDVDFVKVDATTARATISLGANWDYGFNIADGCGHYYGNTGSMNVSNCTGWTMDVDGTDCLMRTTNGATYTFTVDYTTLTAPVVSITYPSANQAADKVIYFDNSARNWSTLHYRIGRTNHTQATAMTKVPGTANLYKVTTAAYNNFSGWHIANNAGWTGDNNSIYRTNTNNDQYSITYATAHEGGAVTDAAITVTPTTSRGMGGDKDLNDNCEFYNYSLTTGMKTQNVSITDYSNGTITVNYTNTSGSAATLTSGSADLAHTVILTSITATPNTGYDASAITINGNAYAANHVVTEATTIAASFTPHVYTITYKDQGNVAFSGTHTDTPSAHPTSHTYNTATNLNSATKAGYTFGGWFTTSACTGEAVTSLGATAYTADITLYAKWTSTASLTAISADVLYQAASMANITFTESDQNFTGLSTNNLFKVYGTDGNAAKGKTVSSTSITDDIGSKSFTSLAYIMPADNLSTESDPTKGAIEIITPSTAGLLYVYTNNTSTNLKLKKKGQNSTTALSGAKYKAVEVEANTHYFIVNDGGKSNREIYGIQYVSTYGVTITTTNVTKTDGATGAGAAIHGKAYEAIFTASAGYTLPSDVTVTIGDAAQTKGIGYTWTVSDGTGTLTVPAEKVTGNIDVTVTGTAAATYALNYECNEAESGCPSNTTASALPNPLPSAPTKDGYTFGGWYTDEGLTVEAVAGAAMTEATTLYAKWTVNSSSECITITNFATSNVNNTCGDGNGKIFYGYKGSVSDANALTITSNDGNDHGQNSGAEMRLTYNKLMRIYANNTTNAAPATFSNVTSVSFKWKFIASGNSGNTELTSSYTVKVGSTTIANAVSITGKTKDGYQTVTIDNLAQLSGYVEIKFSGSSSSYNVYIDDIEICTASMSSCTTPVIPTLSNQSLCEGTAAAAWNATQTASLETGETVSYQWQKKNGSNWDNITGAASATYDVDGSGTVTEAMAGTYRVVVTVSKTGYASSTATKEVTLSVTDGIEVTGITADKATVYPTNSVTLTATASATATWQWYTCTSAEGAGEAIISGAASASYTIASAGAAGTYYYKAEATGSCGMDEMVYTLTVSAAAGGDCETEFWFAKAADKPESATAATHITGTPSGSSSATYTATIDGNSYPITGQTGQKTGNVTIVVPENNEGTLYVVVQGSSSRTITLSKGGVQVGQYTPANSTWGTFTFSSLDAGTYTLVSSGNIGWGIIALKLCSGTACTDPEVTASVNNSTACVGSSVTFTATGAHASANYQWQKYSGGAWTDIASATAATYNIASVATTDALKYRVIATKYCDRTSNEVTLNVPVAPVFGSFTATRSVMATQALSITDVEASDATSYAWYKSADATYDAGTDTRVGTAQELLLASGGEAAGATYYLFCVASNACGSTTSSAITVNVTAFIEEDCATRGTEGAAEFGFQNSGCSQSTYNGTAVWSTGTSNSKILIYSAPDGKYFKTMKVTIASSSASQASYNWSTDGGTHYTSDGVAITGVTTTLTEKTINLSAHGNVNEVKIGRNFGNGESSGTLYVSKICFEYTSACTTTTVTPSTSSKTHTIGESFTKPTFTLGPAAVSSGTLTYSSSDEEIASVDESGNVTFNGTAGTVTITASYAGATIADVDYCASEGSYTITVSCEGGAPMIVAASSVNMSGCNSSVTLNAKTQAGADFAGGSYQWFHNGVEIEGATAKSYTAMQTGVYTVAYTSAGGCTSLSTNNATVTSATVEPEVTKLVPFQYYHVDKTYTAQMKDRHLFSVKGSAAYGSTGKNFKLTMSRNGGAEKDITTEASIWVERSDDGQVDNVMIDLNKLSGKYNEGDELVLTCAAVDCSGKVSTVYKDEITIHVIGATPTLALICSGSNKASGTRKTSELTVGGDFLTGYNVADLCQQTGNTSFDANTEWGLYTELKAHYIVTPVNGYAVFNKLNYEPFDILLLTDYPKASKSDAAATVLDDMAALCDYRPMLSFKAHMVAKTPSKWADKGFTTSPVVPKNTRTRLNIVCYAHPMFEDMKTTATHIQKDNDDPSQIVYTMLTGAGYESSKGLQGFELEAAENFVVIGLTHYNATPADGSPSAGLVTWTPGTEDRMLVTAVERQENLEARMIMFAVNCGAQSKFTETGRNVVLKCLEYLLDDNPLHVADCSFTFDNGAGNSRDAAKQAEDCPSCTGTKGDGKWSTAANWGPDYVVRPGKDTEVKIAAPVTVDPAVGAGAATSFTPKVRSVRILEGGQVEIPAGSYLEVVSTIRRQNGNDIYPTEENDIHIGTGPGGNGTLIFNNTSGDTKAHVGMYSKGFIDYTSNPKGDKNYQYMGVPCVDINAAYNYYGSWIYSWSDKGGGSYGWKKVVNGGIVTTWTGYCITQESAGTYYDISGTLAATGTKDIDVPAGQNMVVGNSWTAPIDISKFATADFENLLGNVYFFNTGIDKDYTSGHTQDPGDRYAPSTYVTVPINSSPYTGDDHIPSLQGFFVKSNGSAGTLHLDYDKHVRGSSRAGRLSGPLHAPARRANMASDEPAVLKIKVSGENYDDKLLLLEREDFTTGFDNGWDGDKWDGNESALYIYTTDNNGTENSVSAIPELEGTVIGFRAGEDDAYTLNFEYLNSDEPLYLYDVENNTYTQIMTGMTYRFFTTDNEKHARFIITRTNGQEVATGVEPVSGSLDRSKAKKLLIEDKMFIIVNGMLYDATGKVVK